MYKEQVSPGEVLWYDGRHASTDMPQGKVKVMIGSAEPHARVAYIDPSLPPGIRWMGGQQWVPIRNLHVLHLGLADRPQSECDERGRPLSPAPVPTVASKLGVNEMRDQAVATSIQNGFTENDVPTSLALIHSEVSEALEAHRCPLEYVEKAVEQLKVRPVYRGENIIHYVHVGGDLFQMVPSTTVDALAKKLQDAHFAEELADIVIRTGDLAGRLKIDLESAVVAKMEKNKTRGFKHGGKLI